MTRFVLFAGQSKTGSTTLQQHLAASDAALRAQGVLYPQAGRLDRGAAHHRLAAAFLRAPHPPEWAVPVDPAAWRGQLADELRDSGAHTVVLASEMFFHADAGALAAALPPGERRVVVALRRQDSFLDASVQQKLKTLQFREVDPAWLAQRIAGGRLDYDAALRRWEAAVGRDAVRVLPFEPALFPDGLVHRLLDLADLAPWPGMAEPPPANRRLGRDALALLQRLHFDVGLDRRRALSLRGALVHWSQANPDPPEWRHVLPPDVRRAVLAGAAAGNAAIHARHPWPGRDALFLAPPVDDVYLPYPGLAGARAAALRDALAARIDDPAVRAALDAAVPGGPVPA
jgi:hypothetical protein